MESKLIIFLVFASLAHGSYVPRLIDNFGLSDEHAAVLNQIVVNQEATQNTFIEGIALIFDTLFDQGVDADVDNSTVNAALVKVKESIDISFGSDLLVLGESCTAVEDARTVSQGLVDDAFPRIYTALRLARAGNYVVNRPAIDVEHAAVLENFEKLADSDYHPLSTCLNSTDADTLIAIQDKKNGSGGALVNLVNAIFNVIRTLAASVPLKCGDEAVVLDRKEYWHLATNRVINTAEHKFSLLRTLYIIPRIDENGIFSDLLTNQFGLSIAFNKYRKAYEVMYDMLLYYVRRADLGIKDEGHEYYTRYDAAVAEVNVRFASSGNLTLDAIPLINPDFAELLAILRDELTEMSYEGDEAFLDVIVGVVAYQGNDWAEIMEIIDHYRDIAISVYEPSNVLIYQFIRNNLTWSDPLDAKLLLHQVQANSAAEDASHRFFDAVEIMARCRHEGRVSQDDYNAIDALIIETYSEVDVLLQTLFASGFYVLQEHSLNQIEPVRRRFVNLVLLN